MRAPWDLAVTFWGCPGEPAPEGATSLPCSPVSLPPGSPPGKWARAESLRGKLRAATGVPEKPAAVSLAEGHLLLPCLAHGPCPQTQDSGALAFVPIPATLSWPRGLSQEYRRRGLSNLGHYPTWHAGSPSLGFAILLNVTAGVCTQLTSQSGLLGGSFLFQLPCSL